MRLGIERSVDWSREGRIFGTLLDNLLEREIVEDVWGCMSFREVNMDRGRGMWKPKQDQIDKRTSVS